MYGAILEEDKSATRLLEVSWLLAEDVCKASERIFRLYQIQKGASGLSVHKTDIVEGM